MIEERSNCVDCGFPCMGPACRNGAYMAKICDRCGDEVERLYEFDGEELCANCIFEELVEVEPEK